MATTLKTKSYLDFSKTLPLPREIVNPKRDWMILLGLLTTLIVAAIAFDGYMYKEIVGGDMYISVKREELVIEDLKTTELDKIILNFNSKRVNMSNLKLENLTDPSI